MKSEYAYIEGTGTHFELYYSCITLIKNFVNYKFTICHREKQRSILRVTVTAASKLHIEVNVAFQSFGLTVMLIHWTINCRHNINTRQISPTNMNGESNRGKLLYHQALSGYYENISKALVQIDSSAAQQRPPLLRYPPLRQVLTWRARVFLAMRSNWADWPDCGGPKLARKLSLKLRGNSIG